MFKITPDLSTCLSIDLGPKWIWSLIFFVISLIAALLIFGLFYLVIHFSSKKSRIFSDTMLKILLALLLTTLAGCIFNIIIHSSISWIVEDTAFHTFLLYLPLIFYLLSFLITIYFFIMTYRDNKRQLEKRTIKESERKENDDSSSV